MQSTIGVMWLSYKKQYVTSRSCYRWKDCWGWKKKVFPSWQLSSLFPLLSLSFQAPHFSFFPPVCFFVGIDLLILKGQCWCVLSHFGHIWLCNLVDCSPPDSSVHGIYRQEYWSGLPYPPPGDRLDPGIEPTAPALQADSSLLSHPGSPRV